ncbi:ATP-grasp domain-containing protein [Paraburkholderia sp. G-4-1-8]|uniref:ATP-grasp domain-containing protein n=2 Tax=Paraburkholderia antibiotica TaxID=2728839 RepID=A0A7X9X7Y3_9BURK|nr:ATP-grasp domain-containing protein [Paraburkholderia antibiotica]
MANDGVLLLSHCGFSFLEDLVAALNARGLRSFVLSSSPLSEHREQRIDVLSRLVDRLIVTGSTELTADDVDSALNTLRENGLNVVSCISVWEGYRELMARANSRLGVPDLTVAQVNVLRDKLRLRNRLADAGLSQARAVEVTRENFESLKSDGRRYFVKPVCGIASYGAFSLRADSAWSTLERIASEAQDDEIYRSAFGSGLTFMAEDYVAGREYSLELIVVSGRIHCMAIHEKCVVTETGGTVLEDCCTSPPVSIDAYSCATGIEWIARVFGELGLRWGCFHVEARHDGVRWDLIEINPRVGGCLISPSVKALNGLSSVLELWLDLLIVSATTDLAALNEFERGIADLAYRTDGSPATGYATFFRAYFARPGKIEFVGLRNIEPAPIVSQVFLKAGDEITQSSREVFLGQLMWCFRRDRRENDIPNLMRLSAEAIEVRYADATHPGALNSNEAVEGAV